MSYTVFGCGNTEWASTYQAVPTLIDGQLAAHGGQRVHPRGEGNAAGDFDADYRAWHGDLWSDLAAALDLPPEVARPAPAGPRLSITLTNRQVTNPVIVSYEAHPALGPGEPRADRAVDGRLRRSVRSATSRSRCRQGRPTRRATTSGSSPATASTHPSGHGPLRA